jgi:hypothetical protein
VKPVGRLGTAGPIGNDRMTHRVQISSKKEIDGEVKDWLRQAYEASGKA